MIITLNVQPFKTVDNIDELVYDNCTELRIKEIRTKEDFDFYRQHLDNCQCIQENRIKKFINYKDNIKHSSEVKFNSVYISFERNGLYYHVLTRGVIYVANDQNKTIKVLN